MRRKLSKGIAAALAAAMVITLAPVDADAAKKPSLSKKKATVKVGKTITLKVKNGKSKAKVTWKSSKKKIAKISKSVSKGNKASAKIKGVKPGKSTITATYKLGKKKAQKLTCKVTVKKDDGSTPTTAPTTAATTAPTTAPTSAPSLAPSSNPTENPSKATATPPKVTKTPTPVPTAKPPAIDKNTSLTAYGMRNGEVITVDGAEEDTEAWFNAIENDLLKVTGSVRGEKKLTAANAKIMWSNEALYLLVRVTKDSPEEGKDSVNIFFDQDETAEGSYADNKNAMAISVPFLGEAKAVSNADAYTWEAKTTQTKTGYLAEIKIGLKELADIEESVDEETGEVIPAVLKNFRCEIQINDGDATINYYDIINTLEYNAADDTWTVKDQGIKVNEDTSLMGMLERVQPMEGAQTAYYTSKGADIIAAANLPEEFETSADADAWYAYCKSKAMTFVDTAFWTDVYAENEDESIAFNKFNIPSYKGNAEKATFSANSVGNREDAQGYIIWDKDYLYVLFDVRDPDIAPGNATHYDTDSVEFFLDEDFSRPNAYTELTETTAGDEIQLRVDALTNVFSANNAGTGTYEMVAHATKVKEDGTGYMAQFIIKLNEEHKSGDVMGMDLQVNDCFTVETEGTDEEGNPTTVEAADRASTLTAYDTTNTGYENPSVFGRVLLVNKDEVVEDETVVQPALKVAKAPTAVTVDGEVDDVWNLVEAVDVANYSNAKAETSSTATAKLLWDADNLYVLAEVKDASIDTTNANAWEQDGIEFFLDEDNSKEATYAENADAFQYRFTGLDTESNPATTDAIATASDAARADYAGIVTEYKAVEGGYVVEVAIPWKDKAAAKVKKQLGFELTVMDCTAGTRTNEVWMLGTDCGKLYENPSLMTTIQLDKVAELTKVNADLSKVTILYGGEKPVANDDGSVTATNVDGLLIPFDVAWELGATYKVKVSGSCADPCRVWLTNKADRASDIQNPMEFETEYTFVASDAESKGLTSINAINIKGASYGAKLSSITITGATLEKVQ